MLGLLLMAWIAFLACVLFACTQCMLALSCGLHHQACKCETKGCLAGGGCMPVGQLQVSAKQGSRMDNIWTKQVSHLCMNCCAVALAYKPSWGQPKCQSRQICHKVVLQQMSWDRAASNPACLGCGSSDALLKAR